MYFRVMASGAVGSLMKKRRPSLEGWARAESREEISWRTGVEDALWEIGIEFEESVEGVVVWMA